MILRYFLPAFLVICLDQITKLAVSHNLVLYESREVIPHFFNLVFVTNTGAAFSLLADTNSTATHLFFIIIGTVALSGLTIYAFRLKRENILHIPFLGLIAGGAAGNIIDRFRFGAVIDFLDFYVGGYHWPAFNVADSAICIGVGVLLVRMLFFEQKK